MYSLHEMYNGEVMTTHLHSSSPELHDAFK